jgi:hypothetical protein
LTLARQILNPVWHITFIADHLCTDSNIQGILMLLCEAYEQDTRPRYNIYLPVRMLYNRPTLMEVIQAGFHFMSPFH